MSNSVDSQQSERVGWSGAGLVREEAERLAVAVLARLSAAQASDVVSRATGWDPDHARRVTAAAGDVAVAVTGLLRELSR
ncbi:MAG: hypothetical protein ACRDTQ_09115, partial [Micromonosporaceae bacterium]